MPREDDLLSDEEVRRTQLEVLRRFANYCDNQGLTYMLAYGTLLGAVRHGGYIPWDDDIDVMMPRTDYERLRVSEVVEGMRVGGSVEDRAWPYSNVKVGDEATVVRGDGPFDSGIGVNIDVFPIDDVATGAGRTAQRVLIRLTTATLVLQTLTSSSRRSLAKQLVVLIGRPVASLVSRKALLRLLHRLATINSSSAEARGVLVGSYQWSVPSRVIDTTSPIDFERLSVRAPEGLAAVLTANYGPNYMSPPPPDQRVCHHTFTAHWR